MHVYPSELVALITKKWEADSNAAAPADAVVFSRLPGKTALEDLISTCYQVSMMREEDRPVTLRLILVPPDVFPQEEAPPSGFLRVLFTTPRPFNEYELRRLSPAVNFERSLIGVEFHPEKGFLIWGIVNSGVRWLQEERGGSKQCNRLPDAFVLLVSGPGTLTLYRGMKILAVLSGGRITDDSPNVFNSQWMEKLFASDREYLLGQHQSFRARSLFPVARIDDEFIGYLQFQLLKRVISVTRMTKHGGSFLIFPRDNPPDLSSDNPPILLKYRFQDDRAFSRQQELIIRAAEVATTALGDAADPDRLVTWRDYVSLRNEAIYELEEAFYEQAQFVASLAAVDGAVVTSGKGVFGFGGMIVGPHDKLTEVARANDAEGKMVSLEKIEGSGARHRSVYHLCNALHQVMAIVVSQDGNAELVKWRNGIITCWDLTTKSMIGES